MKPKYMLIYEDILEKIDKGEYKANTLLPSENDLVLHHDTSRETVRKALLLLSQNGYIQKIRGKGSIVLETKRFDFPVSGLVSFKELSESLGKSSQTIVEKLSVMKPTALIASHLETKNNEEIWEVIRVRKIGEQRVILDKDYFKRSHIRDLTIEICEQSIYQYIEKELNLEIAYAKKVISVQDATEEDRELLDLENYDVVVIVQNYVYLQDTTLFQYTESRHRPDKFKFVDFARRGFDK